MIRAKVLPNIPPSYKELHYVLRECSSAICRDSEIFKAVAKQIMRVDTSVLNKRSKYCIQLILIYVFLVLTFFGPYQYLIFLIVLLLLFIYSSTKNFNA